MKTFFQLRENLEEHEDKALIEQEITDRMFEAMVEIIDEADAWDVVESKIDELSIDTMKSYRTKAKADVAKRGAVADIKDRQVKRREGDGYVHKDSPAARYKNTVRKDYRNLAKAKIAVKKANS
jgi:hypothetical protein